MKDKNSKTLLKHDAKQIVCIHNEERKNNVSNLLLIMERIVWKSNDLLACTQQLGGIQCQRLSYLVYNCCHFICLSHFLLVVLKSSFYSILDLYSKLKVFPSNISLKLFMVYTYTQNQISFQSFVPILWLISRLSVLFRLVQL